MSEVDHWPRLREGERKERGGGSTCVGAVLGDGGGGGSENEGARERESESESERARAREREREIVCV